VGKARNMLLPDCAVLNSLGKHFAFEAAVGMNGAVWIRATDIVENIIIRNTIINSQFLSNIEIEAMVDVIATGNKLKRG
jgi:exosome complex component RRP40